MLTERVLKANALPPDAAAAESKKLSAGPDSGRRIDEKRTPCFSA